MWDFAIEKPVNEIGFSTILNLSNRLIQPLEKITNRLGSVPEQSLSSC